jgi:hypothetical protein
MNVEARCRTFVDVIMWLRITVIALAGAAAVAACGTNVSAQQCVPGQSVGCIGPAACSGFQVCRADGTGFEACICGMTVSSGMSTSSGSGGAAASSTTSTGPTSAASSTSSASSSSSGTGGAGGNWTPKALPGLALWLDSDQGIVQQPNKPGYLLRWLDSSGNGNKAELYQATQNPLMALDPAVLNGHTAIRCVYNGLNIGHGPSLEWGSGDFAIGIVAKGDFNQGATMRWWWKDAQQGAALGVEFDAAKNYVFTAGAKKIPLAPQNDPSVTEFHIMIARGNTMGFRLDDVSGAGSAAGNVDNTGADVGVCLAGTPGANEFELAEVVAVKGALSDADASKLHSYWKTKFGL